MSPDHYSYTVYADPQTARTFDDRRFGGPIGELVAETQAAVDASAWPATSAAGRSWTSAPARAARPLLLARAGAEVTGVDASEQMLAVARDRARAAGRDDHLHSSRRARARVPGPFVRCRGQPARPDALAALARGAVRAVPGGVAPGDLRLPVRREARRGCSPCRGGSAARLRRADRAVPRVLGSATSRPRSRHPASEVRERHRQFVLPIALHKAIGSRKFTTTVEARLERAGLLRRFGSPVTVVAERPSVPDLVTGATGFTGSHLALHLVRAGRQVRALVRDPARAARPRPRRHRTGRRRYPRSGGAPARHRRRRRRLQHRRPLPAGRAAARNLPRR